MKALYPPNSLPHETKTKPQIRNKFKKASASPSANENHNEIPSHSSKYDIYQNRLKDTKCCKDVAYHIPCCILVGDLLLLLVKMELNTTIMENSVQVPQTIKNRNYMIQQFHYCTHIEGNEVSLQKGPLCSCVYYSRSHDSQDVKTTSCCSG